MADISERVCVGCSDTEAEAHLEKCAFCMRWACPDCAHRAFGRRFCSHECARTYFMSGESDDDEDVHENE